MIGSLLGILILLSGSANAALKVSLVTLEPGPHVFESFGHSGLYVEDSVHPENTALYQYGEVSLDAFWKHKDPLLSAQELFEQKLPTHPQKLRGPINRYGQGVLTPLSSRALILDELALDQSQAERLRAMLDADFAGASYPYHSFKNNCATPVRDHLYEVLDPAEKKAAESHFEKKTRQELLTSAFDEAAKLATGHKVILVEERYLTSAKDLLENLQLSRTEYASMDEFEETMRKADELISGSKLILWGYATLKHVELDPGRFSDAFHNYLFGPELTERITRFDAMFLPERIRAEMKGHGHVVRETRLVRDLKSGEIRAGKFQ